MPPPHNRVVCVIREICRTKGVVDCTGGGGVLYAGDGALNAAGGLIEGSDVGCIRYEGSGV